MLQLNNPRDLLCALGATNRHFNALVSEQSQIWSALLGAHYSTRDSTHHLLTARNTPRYIYVWLHCSPTARPLESQAPREFGTFSWFEQQHAVVYQGTIAIIRIYIDMYRRACAVLLLFEKTILSSW
jgi:hypothetical protein